MMIFYSLNVKNKNIRLFMGEVFLLEDNNISLTSSFYHLYVANHMQITPTNVYIL